MNCKGCGAVLPAHRQMKPVSHGALDDLARERGVDITPRLSPCPFDALGQLRRARVLLSTAWAEVRGNSERAEDLRDAIDEAAGCVDGVFMLLHPDGARRALEELVGMAEAERKRSPGRSRKKD